MLKVIRTDSGNKDFISLVELLDADLKIRDGEDHDFYNQFNGIEDIKYAIVAYQDEMAVGCGAIKQFDQNAMEVKRMYVPPKHRGSGIATKILSELEQWAADLGYAKCILETGRKQPEAIALYTKCGYIITPNYGQYTGIDNSVCFEKSVN